jgi:hypothetical protein
MQKIHIATGFYGASTPAPIMAGQQTSSVINFLSVRSNKQMIVTINKGPNTKTQSTSSQANKR